MISAAFLYKKQRRRILDRELARPNPPKVRNRTRLAKAIFSAKLRLPVTKPQQPTKSAP